MVMVAAGCRRGGGMAATSSSLRESRTTTGCLAVEAQPGSQAAKFPSMVCRLEVW